MLKVQLLNTHYCRLYLCMCVSVCVYVLCVYVCVVLYAVCLHAVCSYAVCACVHVYKYVHLHFSKRSLAIH